MKSKTTPLLGLFVVFSTITHARAEVLHWAQPCEKGELVLTNTTAEVRKAWLQKFTTELVDETPVELKSHETQRLALSKTDFTQQFSLLHFETSKTFTAYVTCEKKTYAVNSLEGGVLTFQNVNELALQNLFADTNFVTIDELNLKNEVLFSSTLQLASREMQNFTTHPKAAKVRVSATHRFSVFSLKESGSEGPNLVEPQKVSEIFDSVFFEVGPRTGNGDTFIVQIKDPKLIQKARDQVNNPSLEKIVFAQIEKGASSFNRNRSRPEKSFWSWFPSEVTNISDLGSTTCNGLPQFIEDHVDSWVKDPGRICFWSYRIKREISSRAIADGL